jgi:hypothetical protein
MNNHIDTINRAFSMTGKELRAMLRRERCTIAELSRRLQITQKAIRARLDQPRPIAGTIVIDWTEAARGTLPPRIRAALRSLKKNADEETNFECWLISHRVSF